MQLHGFARQSSDPLAIVSDGTDAPAAATHRSRALAAALADLTGDAVRSCNDPDAVPRLCGTTNVQGRMLNGSPDACGTAAAEGSGRFLHVEQALDLRDADGAVHRGQLVEALRRVVP